MSLSKSAAHDAAFSLVRQAPCHTTSARVFVNLVVFAVVDSNGFLCAQPPFFPQLVNGDIERQEYFRLCRRNKWFSGTSANVTQRVKRARGVRGGAQRPPRKR